MSLPLHFLWNGPGLFLPKTIIITPLLEQEIRHLWAAHNTSKHSYILCHTLNMNKTIGIDSYLAIFSMIRCLTTQGRLVEKIWRYLSAAATRHTAVAKALSAHNAKSTFWKREDSITSKSTAGKQNLFKHEYIPLTPNITYFILIGQSWYSAYVYVNLFPCSSKSWPHCTYSLTCFDLVIHGHSLLICGHDEYNFVCMSWVGLRESVQITQNINEISISVSR